MWVSTKPMKTTPDAAMSSFSVIVEREALAPWTSGVVSIPCSAAGGRVWWSPRDPTLLLGSGGHPVVVGVTACDISRPAVPDPPPGLYLVLCGGRSCCSLGRGGGHGVDRRSRVDSGTHRRTGHRTHPGRHRDRNPARRPLVARPADDVRRVLLVRRLRDVPGVLRPGLLLLALPLAVLLALPGRLRRGRLGLRPAVLVVPALRGADHPDLPARLPDDLLLLPQGLLPVVLALAARLRGRGAARLLLGRDEVPAARPERPPLLLVRRDRGRPDPHLRRRAGLPQRRARVGTTWASAPC